MFLLVFVKENLDNLRRKEIMSSLEKVTERAEEKLWRHHRLVPAINQTLRKTCYLVSFYDDDMWPSFLCYLNIL
jgi:hypothetical protein